jgi:diguanylate cyclase (GGDEF)-like protein
MHEGLNHLGVIQNYKLLQDLGVFNEFDALARKIANLEELLLKAADIFRKGTLDELIANVTNCLNEKFIPSYLVFILQENKASTPRHFAFKNLKPMPSPIEINRLQPYENFFTKYPHILGFSLFEYQFAKPEESNRLLPAKPEIIVPVMGISGGLYGLIIFSAKVVGSGYSTSELEYIDKLMQFTSIAIQNNIHYKNSVTDPKTSLFNSSFFIQRLIEEKDRAERYNAKFCVLILDLDFFKNLNDNHGHIAGDIVLQAVSQTIHVTIRKSDIAARFGGEEFTILLCETDKLTGYQVAERIRKKIEALRVKVDNKELTVTVSVGCSTYDGKTAATYQELIEQADIALYRSKAEGRNRTTMYNCGLLLKAHKFFMDETEKNDSSPA